MGVVAMKDGGPAFPTDEWFDEELIGQYPGMTLRDYFAGQALQQCSYMTYAGSWSYDDLAQHSYKCADAMLKAREES